MRYVAAVEIVDPFDHVYKLSAEELKGKPLVDTWEYLSLLDPTDQHQGGLPNTR